MPVGLNETPVGFVDPACPLDWSHPLNRGLVARWKVVPNSGWRGGLTFRNLVRGGKNLSDGTLTNGVTWVGKKRTGGFGSLLFDRSLSQYVACGSSTPFDSDNWAISAWILCADVSSVAQIRSVAYYSDGPTIWKDNGSGDLSIVHSGTVDFALSITLVSNVWSHVLVARTGSTVTAYHNGKQTAQNTSFAATYTKSGNIRLGASEAYGEYLNGNLDDVLLYTRGLSSREVSQLYQEQLRGSPETLRWVGATTYGISTQTVVTGGTPIFSSGIFTSGIIAGGGIVA